MKSFLCFLGLCYMAAGPHLLIYMYKSPNAVDHFACGILTLLYVVIFVVLLGALSYAVEDK